MQEDRKLIVKLEPQSLSVQEWEILSTPMDLALRNGVPFADKTTKYRDDLLMLMLYSAGLKHTLSLLPLESLELLREELKEDWREVMAVADQLSRERFLKDQQKDAKEEEIRDIARRMILKGMSIDMINNVTGLSKEDVMKIVNQTME